MRVIRLDTVGSTNDEARERAHAGEPMPFAVVARTQNAGRGRSGRRWASPMGGIWMTFACELDIRVPPSIALRVAVAVSDAVRECVEGGGRVTVKWPNDLLIDGRKCGGILVETQPTDGDRHLVLVGVGLNADFDAEDLPEDLRFPGTTLRTALSRSVDIESLTGRLIEKLAGALAESSPLLTEHELALLLDRLAFLDERISLKRVDGSSVVGVLEGLAPDGRIAVRTEEGVVLTDAGELSPVVPGPSGPPPLG